MSFVFNNIIPLSKQDVLKQELDLYERTRLHDYVIPEEINCSEFNNCRSHYITEKLYNFPQGIFIIDSYNGYKILGRKFRSQLHIENKINAPHCSQITAQMLLGFFVCDSTNGMDLKIEFKSFSDGQKKYVFDNIKSNSLAEITFPYLFRNYNTGLEKECSPDGWSLNPDKAMYLGNGEQHFRDYTIDFLRNKIKENHVVFDPACSTGQFLKEIKNKFPFITTIGQDLSRDMVNYAKNTLDKVYLGDAISSPVENESIDYMFLRFLNSEIVSKEHSKLLFDSLTYKVKNNGYIILFGHTPVLLNADFFLNRNFMLMQTNAYSKVRNSIFQYYILKKVR
jgi:isonocardicin synthase